MLGRLALWHHRPTGQARARVLLIHGISEHSGRHIPTIDFLNRLGLEVVRFDLRGAGLSGGRRQYVDHFQEYVDDVARVHGWIVAELPRLPLIVLGHSLGGAIAAYFASSYGAFLNGLVLSAPAFQLGGTIAVWKVALGRLLVRVVPSFRMYSSDSSALSRDPAVGRAYESDELSYRFNTLAQGKAVLDALEKLPTICRAINVPTCLFHGTSDRVILAQGSYTLFQALGTRDRELHYLPGGYHEPHLDVDSAVYFRILRQWIDRRLEVEAVANLKPAKRQARSSTGPAEVHLLGLEVKRVPSIE